MAVLVMFLLLDGAGWQPHPRITAFECVIVFWLFGNFALIIPRQLAGHPDDELSPVERLLIVVVCLSVFLAAFGAGVWLGADLLLILLIAGTQMMLGVGKAVINQWMPDDRKFLPICWARYPGWAGHAAWFFAMEDLLRALILIRIAQSGDAYLAIFYFMVLDHLLHKAAHVAFMISMWMKGIDAHSEEP